MHFYSDHFAAGHMSRVGRMRLDLPKNFGTWGSILVNNAHNEDNFNSVQTTNPFQPPEVGPLSEDQPFTMIREDNAAYGDGTYMEHGNRGNRNMLINGMDNSLGDVYRARATGAIRHNWEYGGLAFMPEIDLHKRQKQPLLVQDRSGKIYYRKDISRVKILSPLEYQDTRFNPEKHGYTELTYWSAFVIVFKLRVLGFVYSPTVVPHDEIREKELQAEEKRLPPMKGLYSMTPPLLYEEPLLNPINKESTPVPNPEHGVGDWRKTPPVDGETMVGHGLFNLPKDPLSRSLLGFLRAEQRTPDEVEPESMISPKF